MLSAKTLIKKVIQNLKRPPNLSLSEWSAENRILSSEESSIPGKWNPDFIPFQSGIMDAITNPEVERVVMLCSTRVGKTFIATCAIGYYSDLDPAPVLVVKPRGEDCNSFSKQELQWLFINTPVLQNKLAANEGKVSTNTLHFKQLTTGGSIRLAGSNSPAALAGFSSRIVICDEIDKYEPIVGFGNPIDLAIGRTSTFPHNKKIIILSSPTLAHTAESKRKTIHSEFLNSSQAYFHIPCPHCGTFQALEWENVRFGHCRVKLDDVYYQCNSCNKKITEAQKKVAISSGKWVETYPEIKTKGFHISQLYSPFTTLEKIVEEWLLVDKSRDIFSIMRFKNEVLGLPFEEDLGLYRDSSDILYNRRERYPLVPMSASLLTCAVDTQDSWLSYSVIAWGLDREAWVYLSGRIEGDPSTPGPWEALSKVIYAKYKHENGTEIGIEKTLIDTQGHQTQHVNRFLKGKGPVVQGIYGARQQGKPIITKAKRDSQTGLRKWEIGTENAKTDIFQMLTTEKPGPLYIHFPFECNEEYFKELYSERKVNGQFKKIGSRRNEKLDELAYNLAAYYICLKNYTMEQRAEMIKQASVDMNTPEDTEPELDSLEEIDTEAEKPTEPQEIQPVLVYAGVEQVPAGSEPVSAANKNLKEEYINKFRTFNSW